MIIVGCPNKTAARKKTGSSARILLRKKVANVSCQSGERHNLPTSYINVDIVGMMGILGIVDIVGL